MKIIIAGGTGFIGRDLVTALLAESHEIFVLSRSIKKVETIFGSKVKPIIWYQIGQFDANQFDAVINLTGENIGEKRWTNAVKQAIKTSRIDTTKLLAQWCAAVKNPPHLYNASAIGIYGLQPIHASLALRLTEDSDVTYNHVTQFSHDFLSEVGREWENATTLATTAGVPVTIMRFAPVLKKDAGILKKLTPIFNLGLGGPIGSGKQAFSWVHIADLVSAIQFLLKHPRVVGPINISAPECVMQKTFAKTLAKVMHRPALLPTPAWVLKLLFGQMAEELLLSGQNMYPARLLENGYNFLYRNLDAALKHEWNE